VREGQISKLNLRKTNRRRAQIALAVSFLLPPFSVLEAYNFEIRLASRSPERNAPCTVAG
jgi:hypothetical protein